MRIMIMVAALAACGAPATGEPGQPATIGETGGELRLTVQPVVVSPGDSVTVTLTTTLEAGVGYNLCTSVLQHHQGLDWHPLESDRVCTMELRTLKAGDEARFTFHLPATLGHGEYRYLTRVERLSSGEMTGVESEPFTVN